MDGSTPTAFIVVAKAALAFTLASSLLALAAVPLASHATHWTETVGMVFVILLPVGLTSWWILRKLRRERPLHYARGAAVAFALSAPILVAAGYLLAEIVGGWTEYLLGTRFVLPGLIVFMAIFVSIVPALIVLWAAPRCGTKQIVGIREQNEHS